MSDAVQFLQPIAKIVSKSGAWHNVELRCGHCVLGVPRKYKPGARVNCTQCHDAGQGANMAQPIYRVATRGNWHWVSMSDGTGWTIVSTSTKSRAKAERDFTRIATGTR